MSYAAATATRLNSSHGSVIPASAPAYQHPARRTSMNAMKITGIVLIVLGLAGFFTGGFSFTKDTSKAKLGPLELVVKEKETVNFPQWLSLGAVLLGAVVLVMGSRKP
jgi:drug/metabolite transporter (DMT)-like permease